MPDILNTGVSGLLAFQRALGTTSHNISNVNTPGFSRQRTDLATRIPEPTGAGFIGSGVMVVGVERFYDQFLSEQLRTQTSINSRLDSYYKLSSQVDNLLADPDAGLAPALQEYFDAVNGVADNPASIPARQVLLSQADSLVHRFHTIDERLAGLSTVVNDRIGSVVNEINTLAQSIADVNESIVLNFAQAGGSPPNDLLDKRDLLLRQLSELVPVSTVAQDNGATNVFIGNGQVLVLGMDANQLNVSPNIYDPYKMEITLGSGTNPPNVTNFLNGGAIGGVLNFRSQILEPAINALGRVALGLAQTFNQQHSEGLDLYNQLGGNFFSVTGLTSAGQAADSTNNTGNGALSFTVTDTTQLTTSDYRIDYDGANYTVTRLSDNTTYGPMAPGAVAGQGFSFALASGTPQAGDSFLIQPTRSGARDVALLITDTKKIAAAGPVRSSASVTNLGNAIISQPETLDITNANFFTTVTIEMDDSNADGVVDRYTTDGGGTWTAYTSGANIDVNGWRVQVTGTPLDGDTFIVQKNNDAVGDNRNALKLAALDTTPILDGGTTSFQNAYGQMVSEVGARTHQADIDLAAQSTVLQQTEQAVEAVSGVNLDEEAANMVRFQQAYQAAAQMINVAQSLFDTLLDAVRR